MPEIIELVEAIAGYKFETDDYSSYEGYRIKTSERDIRVLVSSESSCCENFGYISSDDNLSQFVGAELIEVWAATLDDRYFPSENLYVKKLVDLRGWDERGPDVFEAAFVYIETSRGPLTLAVYNEHNGYYGHEVLIDVQGPAIRDPLN